MILEGTLYGVHMGGTQALICVSRVGHPTGQTSWPSHVPPKSVLGGGGAGFTGGLAGGQTSWPSHVPPKSVLPGGGAGFAGGQNSCPSQVPPKSVLPPGPGFGLGARVPGAVPAGGFGAPCEGAAGFDAGAEVVVVVAGEDGVVLSVFA